MIEERTRFRRLKAEIAIQMAIENRWEEALETNKAILELFPDDIDAYNRLGKALTELGRYAEAHDAYTKALVADPTNTIARKNLERLAALMAKSGPTPPRAETGPTANPNLFISEVGKSGSTTLTDVPADILLKATVGDEVFLKVHGATLIVENAKNEFLGMVEPKLGLRLSKLMEGGNRYTAAITHLSERELRILIKETYQHPDQIGKLSFLPTGTEEAFRPYIRESLVKREIGDEIIVDEEDWEDGTIAKDVEEQLYSEQAPLDLQDSEEEEPEAEVEEEDYEVI